MDYSEIIRIAELFRSCSKYSKIHTKHIQYSLYALYNNQEGIQLVNNCCKSVTNYYGTNNLPDNYNETKNYIKNNFENEGNFSFSKNAIIYFCGVYKG